MRTAKPKLKKLYELIDPRGETRLVAADSLPEAQEYAERTFAFVNVVRKVSHQRAYALIAESHSIPVADRPDDDARAIEFDEPRIIEELE